MTDAISSAATSAVNTGTTSTSASASNSGTEVSKNMFLQLLVAQIKNQDPLNPTDGVQFLTQLAQFQQLEQSMNMGVDLSAVRADLDAIVKANSQTNTTQNN